MKTNKVIVKAITDNYARYTASSAKKTVSTFEHVKRGSNDDVPACRYHRVTGTRTRLKLSMNINTDTVYVTPYQRVN